MFLPILLLSFQLYWYLRRDHAETRSHPAAEQSAADSLAPVAAAEQRQEPAFEQAVPAMAAPPTAKEGEALTKPPEFADFPFVDRGPASARQRAIQAEETTAATGPEATSLTGTAEAAGQSGQTLMPSSIGESNVEAAQQGAGLERAVEFAEKLPQPPQTPAQPEPLASVRAIQWQAEGGSLPAMVALAGMETQLKTVMSGSAAAPAGGDAAFKGGVTDGAEQQLSSAGETPPSNVNPTGQAGASAMPEVLTTAAASDLVPEASLMPEGWHRQALDTLPADVRARLAHIDDYNASRMQAAPQTVSAGEAPAVAAAGTPVEEIVDEVFIKVRLVVLLLMPFTHACCLDQLHCAICA